MDRDLAPVDHDWGVDDPMHPRGAEALQDDGPSSVLRPEELPEVVALGREGWFLAPEAPMWVFLPAIWPRAARTWVTDRSTRYTDSWMRTSAGTTYSREPSTAWERESVEADMDHDLARLAMRGRPRGRLWLLRPPPGLRTLEDTLDEIYQAADERGIDPGLNPLFVAFASHRLRELFAQV